MSAYSSIEVFYSLDERRRRSPEIDYGVWWRWQDQVFRVTFVEATGELIAVQLSAPSIRAGSFGLALIGGEPLRVLVLSIIADRDLAEELLEGWAEICGRPDSLSWVAERVLAPPLHEVVV